MRIFNTAATSLSSYKHEIYLEDKRRQTLRQIFPSFIIVVKSVIQDTTTDYIEKIKLLLRSGLEYYIERVSVKFV